MKEKFAHVPFDGSSLAFSDVLSHFSDLLSDDLTLWVYLPELDAFLGGHSILPFLDLHISDNLIGIGSGSTKLSDIESENVAFCVFVLSLWWDEASLGTSVSIQSFLVFKNLGIICMLFSWDFSEGFSESVSDLLANLLFIISGSDFPSQWAAKSLESLLVFRSL